MPFPSPGDLPDPQIEPQSPALQADSSPTELCGKPSANQRSIQIWNSDRWVFKKLFVLLGKIPELLASGMVGSLTKLVLVNAIYFKGNWQEKFMVEATKDAPFRLNKVRGDDRLGDSVLRSHTDSDGRSVFRLFRKKQKR